jgi:hypothetical protein
VSHVVERRLQRLDRLLESVALDVTLRRVLAGPAAPRTERRISPAWPGPERRAALAAV